jgi:hypothetical protein
MQAQGPSERIRSARANVRLATQICGTVDLPGLQHAIHLLEDAAAEMGHAESSIRQDMPDGRDTLRHEAALLKSEIARMVRVIDGCASLYRGLSVRLGCTALTYTSQGNAVESSTSAVAAREMQA